MAAAASLAAEADDESRPPRNTGRRTLPPRSCSSPPRSCAPLPPSSSPRPLAAASSSSRLRPPPSGDGTSPLPLPPPSLRSWCAAPPLPLPAPQLVVSATPMSAPMFACPSDTAPPPAAGVRTLYSAWKPSSSSPPPTSMSPSLVLTSMNALLRLEYLVGHNRTRELSQTSSTKQPSDSIVKIAQPKPASTPGRRRKELREWRGGSLEDG